MLSKPWCQLGDIHIIGRMARGKILDSFCDYHSIIDDTQDNEKRHKISHCDGLKHGHKFFESASIERLGSCSLLLNLGDPAPA